MTRALSVGLVILMAVSNALAAKKPADVVPLTEKGQKLEAQYAEQLTALQRTIAKALPAIDEQKAAEFLALYQAESTAMKNELNALRGQDRKPADHPSKAVYTAAKEALALASTNALVPTTAMLKALKSVLESDRLDADLAAYSLISHATPRGLAEYAQQGRAQEKVLERLLKNDDLVIQMAMADGAKDGKYGRAMEIYEGIQKASKRAAEGVLQKLALGISLEHAVPIGQRNPAAATDAPKTVDPVKRYLHYEKAYLGGELDSGFEDLCVWDYRLVVNGSEPDETLAWGREMLRNYRPDHVSTGDYRWRYVKAVKTDVRYGSQYNKFDKPELQFFQNIIMNGGICGRRAFFGRFILRAFGVPTTARPQRGHATLTHWTPDGWAICLGAGWSWGWTSFGQDRDFLAHTQARMTGTPFKQVQRAKMIGTALGEAKVFGFHDAPSGFWNGVALYRQRQIVEEAEAVALAAVGTDIGEANESKVKEAAKEVVLTDEDKAVVVDGGTLTVPAVACTFGTNSPGKVLFMDSSLGGKQMHYSRNGKPVDFTYTIDAPKAGKYALSARVVTVTGDQHVMVAVNDAAEPVDLALPLTIGMWGKTDPVEVTLAKGKNVLTCSRGGENIRGVTIKDFTLEQL